MIYKCFMFTIAIFCGLQKVYIDMQILISQSKKKQKKNRQDLSLEIVFPA